MRRRCFPQNRTHVGSKVTFDIVHGDCLERLARLPADCVDAFVEDPPYGLSFMGKGWDHAVPGPEYFAAQLRVAKPGAHLVAFGGTRTYHRLACAIEDAGWELRDCLMWLYGTGFPKSHNLKGDHEGWGTALKPAWEPIILARKPFKGTVAANVLAHGTGAINIGATRIDAPDTPETPVIAANAQSRYTGVLNSGAVSAPEARTTSASQAGRWPANVILDPEAGAVLDAQSGTLKSGVAVQRNRTGKTHSGVTNISTVKPAAADVGYADSGGASRFFYCAKASKGEREAGLEDFQPQQVGDGRETPADNAYQRGKTQRKNTHTTVKPISLMRWCCRLVTPPGGLIVDPFCGSGSTGCAAVSEGFNFIGIDREAEYVAIARARVAHWEANRGS